MAVTLRRRLKCHYCGKTLGTASKKNNRIHCTNCLADNFFDDDDNIIDAPIDETNYSNLQPAEIESESNIFCRTCLTNQSFYVRALADYLPEDEDPRYDELEAALPTFKKELDLRFPRCCINCAPRVDAQIKQANYQAKSDHVRRMMKKSSTRAASMQYDVRNLIVSLAGIGYGCSLFTQLLWHGLASQTETTSAISGLSLGQCLRQWPVPRECSAYAASTVPISLLVGLLCIWWNPHWQQRLRGKEGRLVGLRRYYFVQVLVLTLRSAVWILAKDSAFEQLEPQVLHVVALVTISMFSVFAIFGTIKLDTTPLVDWKNVQQPLVDPNQFRPPSVSIYAPEHLQSQSFNLESMAGASRQPLQSWVSPDPADVDGEMDWEPVNHNFNPRPRIVKQKFDQPSPFYGNLPAAPTRGALYNNRPPPEQKKALGITPGFFGLSKPSDGSGPSPIQPTKTAQPSFAPATFFAHEREADTGLENIFDKMFSVRDSRDAKVSAVAKENDNAVKGSTTFTRTSLRPRSRSHLSVKPSSTANGSLAITCTITASLFIVISSLCTKELTQHSSERESYRALQYTIAIPLLHELDAVLQSKTVIPRRMLKSGLELTAPIIGVLCLPAERSPFISSWNKLVIGILCLFLLLELYNFIQLQNNPVSSVATAQMVESMNKVEQTEESATSHPSPPHLHHSQPTQMLYSSDFRPIRKTNSNESMTSNVSVQTTSTAAGWKTPKSEVRNIDWQRNRRPSSPITRGFDGLSLSHDFGSGSNITAPRRQPPFGQYRF